jgi:hypothetical protein
VHRSSVDEALSRARRDRERQHRQEHGHHGLTRRAHGGVQCGARLESDVDKLRQLPEKRSVGKRIASVGQTPTSNLRFPTLRKYQSAPCSSGRVTSSYVPPC